MIAIGKLVKTVGLKGELKLYPYAPEPSCFEGCDLWIGGQQYRLAHFRMQKGMGHLRLEGLEHIDAVQPLINQEVLMEREQIALEEDEFFSADLVGLEVQTETGEVLGKIAEVLSPAAHDVFVVRGDSEILIPVVDEFIRSIDLEQGRVIVRLIEGMR